MTREAHQLSTANPQVPKGYKLTEVGVIPEDWNIINCEELCLKIQDGTHFSPKLGGYDYLYVTSKNIGFGVLDVSDAERIDATQHKSIYARCDVKQGDLLLTKDGANTGNAAINYLSEEFSLLSSVAFLRFNHRLHEPRYYLQYILSSSGQSRIKELMSGNAITRLTLEKIRKLRFPVPPLPEQQAIAEALSKVDALITSLDQLIAKKRNIKQGAMQQLLTGNKRLAGFSAEWEEKKLGEIGDFKNGINKGKEDFGFGYPFVNLLDVFGIPKVSQSLKLGLVNSTENERKVYSLKRGDVLFVRSSVKPEGVGLTSLMFEDLKDTVYSGFLITQK